MKTTFATLDRQNTPATRVTPLDIENQIAQVFYAHGSDIAWQANMGGSAPDFRSLSRLTFCVIVLKNGYTVTGESSCVSPENFNAETGRTIARENAVNKIWPLLGYELRTKLKSREGAPVGHGG